MSYLPVIRDENWEDSNTNTNEVHIIRTDYGILEGRPPRIKTIPPMEYVEHPVAFDPVSTNPVIYLSETESTEPSTSPLDVTMLAMLGLTMAGAGLMKSESAIAKQKEQEAKKAQELAGLQAQLDAQKADASANWEANLAMQAEASQDVMVGVKQSQANKNYWAAYAIWKAKVALAEEKKRQAQFQALIQAYLVWKASQNTHQASTPVQTPSSNTHSVAGGGGFIGVGGFGFGAGGGFIGIGSSIINQIRQSFPRFNQEPTPTPTPEPESDALAVAGVGALPFGSLIGELIRAAVANAKIVVSGVVSTVTALPILAMPIAATFVFTGFLWVMLNPTNGTIWTEEMRQQYQNYRMCDSVAPSERGLGCNTLPFPSTTPGAINVPPISVPTQIATVAPFPAQTPLPTFNNTMIPPPILTFDFPVETPTLTILEFHNLTQSELTHINRLSEDIQAFINAHPIIYQDVQNVINGIPLAKGHDHVDEFQRKARMLMNSIRALETTAGYELSESDRTIVEDAISRGYNGWLMIDNILGPLSP